MTKTARYCHLQGSESYCLSRRSHDTLLVAEVWVGIAGRKEALSDESFSEKRCLVRRLVQHAPFVRGRKLLRPSAFCSLFRRINGGGRRRMHGARPVAVLPDNER